MSITMSFAFLGAVWIEVWLGRVVLPIAITYSAMSLIALAIYAWDKSCAERGTFRTPEKSLHLLELFGGWPGALIAQQWLRHKNRKLSYQIVFWLIVLTHFGVWIFVMPRK